MYDSITPPEWYRNVILGVLALVFLILPYCFTLTVSIPSRSLFYLIIFFFTIKLLNSLHSLVRIVKIPCVCVFLNGSTSFVRRHRREKTQRNT